VPTALGEPGSSFAPPVMGALAGLRVGYTTDLGGAFRVDPEVVSVLEEAGRLLVGSGASVFAAHPDLSLGEDTFRTLRAWHFQASFGDLLGRHPDDVKPSLAENIRAGEGLSGADVARAYQQRTALADTMHRFFQDHDLLLLPTSQVPPFPADQEYPTEVDGEPTTTYLDWMRSAYLITVTGCPALSIPAGHTPRGLPVGVQLVAPHGQDRRLLEIAAAFELARGW
jgi:amidase